MKAELQYQGLRYQADLSKPLDISVAIQPGQQGVNCFYAPIPEAWPVVAGSFIGDTQQGGAVNFFNLKINPHGNGTHTECVGHIARERFSINKCLQQFHFFARLISIFPQKLFNGDRVILQEQVEPLLSSGATEALVIRTMPNDNLKKRTNYSGANPPYLDHELVKYLVSCGVQHLLVDLPSVDREEDGGKLLAHRAFWQYPEKIREHCTISELVYVDNNIQDGLYWLNLQIISLELDASPSKPVLYQLEPIS